MHTPIHTHPLNTQITQLAIGIDAEVEVRRVGWYTTYIFPHTSALDSVAYSKRGAFIDAVEKLADLSKKTGTIIKTSHTGYGHSFVVDEI